MVAAVSGAGMTDYRPPFSVVIDVPVDESLGFNSCFVTYPDYVLSIHYFTLSFANFNNFWNLLSSLIQTFVAAFLFANFLNIPNFFGPIIHDRYVASRRDMSPVA